MGPSSSMSGKLFKVQYVLQFSLKHDVMGASQKTLPDAQIPVMIMTPSISCLQLNKPKIQQHPNWQPYAFDNVECRISEEAESKNEYATYRNWLIAKEQEFVQKYSKVSSQSKKEEQKKEGPIEVEQVRSE